MMHTCKILHSDIGQHSAFFRFIDSIFHGSRADNWALWRDRGGWTEDYEVFAIIDGAEIVSTIGRSRMRLVINGQARVGYQLGAVATLERYRRNGLARRLMDWVIAELDDPDQPVILFANESVSDFYPRLGFRHIPQRRSIARLRIEPAREQASRCDLSSAAVRARLENLCARARPTSGELSACDYFWILLWNLTCGPATAFWLHELDAVIATTIEHEKLVVHDLIAVHGFDLRPLLPTLVQQPVKELEFLFDPADWWPTVSHSEFDDADSRLFVRGAAAAIFGAVQFPELAHT